MCHSVITIPDHTDTLCHLHHTKLRKYKFIFLNSCQRKSPISNTEEFLNLCQDGKNASMCLGDNAEQQVQLRAIHDNTRHLTSPRLIFIPTGVVAGLNLHNMTNPSNKQVFGQILIRIQFNLLLLSHYIHNETTKYFRQNL